MGVGGTRIYHPPLLILLLKKERGLQLHLQGVGIGAIGQEEGEESKTGL